jgi:hypothetical protein
VARFNNHAINSELTTAPSPEAPTPVPSVPQDIWIPMATYAARTGPVTCIQPFDATVTQTPVTVRIAIERSGDTIDVITEHDRYVGTVVTDAYSATDSDVGTWQCGAVQLNYRSEGHVSGHFSADGGSLMGEEGPCFGSNLERQSLDVGSGAPFVNGRRVAVRLGSGSGFSRNADCFASL